MDVRTVKAYSRLDTQGHDSRTTAPLNIVAARPGFLDGRFDVKPEHCECSTHTNLRSEPCRHSPRWCSYDVD